MRVARGSTSLLSSHGRGIRPLDALKDSQDLSRVLARIPEAEEPEIKLPTSAGSSKKQESSRKTSTSAYQKIDSGLAKKFIPIFPLSLKGKPERTFCPAQ